MYILILITERIHQDVLYCCSQAKIPFESNSASLTVTRSHCPPLQFPHSQNQHRRFLFPPLPLQKIKFSSLPCDLNLSTGKRKIYARSLLFT